jgi:hypothetical protein
LYHTNDAGSNPSNGGRAEYQFNVTTAGSYVIQFLMDAPDDGHNSLWYNIGAEPSGTETIWDVPFTVGFENRIAGWRGTGGTFSNNLLVPKVFSLPSGTWSLIVRGREHGTAFQGIVILKVE